MRSDDLPVISANVPLGEAIIKVSAGRLGLCVILDGDRVAGIITDGDIRRAMQSLGNKFFNVEVGKVMTQNPKCVDADTKVKEVQEIMQRKKIHAVLVTDEDHHLLGIVDSFSCVL